MPAFASNSWQQLNQYTRLEATSHYRRKCLRFRSLDRFDLTGQWLVPGRRRAWLWHLRRQQNAAYSPSAYVPRHSYPEMINEKRLVNAPRLKNNHEE